MADSVQMKIADLEEVEITATIRLSVARWREVVKGLPVGHPLQNPLLDTLGDLGKVVGAEILKRELCGISHPTKPGIICGRERGHTGPCGDLRH